MNSKQYSIAFVVLHYNVLQETLACVTSIKQRIDTNNYHIVVVDNKSPNGTGIELFHKYQFDSKVDVLLLDENAGFANGNNVGIEYSKEKLKADFVCCLNNDTLLEQSDFFSNIVLIYKNSDAAVIGPQILDRDGKIYMHPGMLLPVDIYRKQLRNWQRFLQQDVHNRIRNELLNTYIVQSAKNFFSQRHKCTNRDNEGYYCSVHEDIILHGCCLIFTPIFFTKLHGFCKETFLYNEEEILYLDLLKNGLHNIYSPKIRIRHLENVATDSIVKTNMERKRFFAQNKVKSLCILISKCEECNIK